MFYKVLQKVVDTSNSYSIINELLSLSYDAPEGIVSFTKDHHLKHSIRSYNVQTGTVDYESSFVSGEAFLYNSTSQVHKFCIFDKNTPKVTNGIVKYFGLVLSDFDNEYYLLHSALYAVNVINRDGGLGGNYIDLKTYYCEFEYEDCYKHIVQLQNNEDILFVIVGNNDNSLLYYYDKMKANNNTEKFLIDFPQSSYNLCNDLGFHFSYSENQIAKSLVYLSLETGKKVMIVYSKKYKSLTDYTESYYTRYHMSIYGKYLLNDQTNMDYIIAVITANTAITILDMSELYLSTQFRERYCQEQLDPKIYPIIGIIHESNYFGISSECLVGHYYVTTFHETLGANTVNQEDEEGNTVPTPTIAPSFVVDMKGYIGRNQPILPITEQIYSAITCFGQIYEEIYSNNASAIRAALINRYFTTPSGGISISNSYFVKRRIWAIHYTNTGNELVYCIDTSITPDIFNSYDEYNYGKVCVVDGNYRLKVVTKSYKYLIFYHEFTGDNQLNEIMKAMSEEVFVNDINMDQTFTMSLVPIYVFGYIDHNYLEKQSKGYLFNNDVIGVFGCSTPFCRDAVSKAYDEERKLFFYTGYSEGESCSQYILNFGGLPNQKLDSLFAYAKRSEIVTFLLIGSTDDYTSVYINQSIKYITLYNNTLLGTCRFDLYGKNYNISGLNDCINYYFYNNVINGRLAVITFYYGDSFINYLQYLIDDNFNPTKAVHFILFYDRNLVKRYNFKVLENSLIVTLYEPNIVSDENKLYSLTMRDEMYHNIYVSETMEVTYTALKFWKELMLMGISRNNGEIPNQDYLRILAREVLLQSPACSVSLKSSNYITNCVYLLQINRNNDAIQVYPTSGEQNMIDPRPYLHDEITEEKCSFGKLESIYEYNNSVVLTIRIVYYILMIIIVMLFVFIKKYDNTRTVRLSSPSFSYSMLVGLFLLSTTAFIFTIRPTDQTWVCDVRVWGLSLSICIVFGILLTKAWRIHKLFNNQQLKKVTITNTQLFKIVGGIVVVQCLYIMMWWLIKPSKSTFNVNSGYSSYYENVFVSECTESYPFIVIELLLMILFMFWGCHLAWKVRKASAEFNESISLAFTVISILFIGCICIILNFMLSSEPSTLMIIRAIGIELGVIIIIFFQFGNKMVNVYTEVYGGSTTFIDGTEVSSKASRKMKKSVFQSSRYSKSITRQAKIFFINPYKTTDFKSIATAVLPYIKYLDPDVMKVGDNEIDDKMEIFDPRSSIGGYHKSLVRASALNPTLSSANNTSSVINLNTTNTNTNTNNYSNANIILPNSNTASIANLNKTHPSTISIKLVPVPELDLKDPNEL